MDYEIRTYIQHYGNDLHAISEVLSCFGWTPEDKRIIIAPSSTNTQISFVRDRDMKNYAKLYELENSYESLEKEKEEEPVFDSSILLICFLLLIIPGFIYILYKIIGKTRVKKKNKAIEKKMEEIIQEAKTLTKRKEAP